MKKIIAIALIALFVTAVIPSFAQEESSEKMCPMMDKVKGKGKMMMMHKGKTMSMMKEMQGTMMEMMGMMKQCKGMKNNKAMMGRIDGMMARCKEMMADTDEIMARYEMMKKKMMSKEVSEESAESAEMPSGHESHH